MSLPGAETEKEDLSLSFSLSSSEPHSSSGESNYLSCKSVGNPREDHLGLIDCNTLSTSQRGHTLRVIPPTPAPRKLQSVTAQAQASPEHGQEKQNTPPAINGIAGAAHSVMVPRFSELLDTESTPVAPHPSRRSIPLPCGISELEESMGAITLNGGTPPQPRPRMSLSLPPLHQKVVASEPPPGDDRMFSLRGYQLEISHNMLKSWNDIIILPTGTGKTPVAINVIKKHLIDAGKSEKPPKILFLAPRVVLVEQQFDVITSHLPVEFSHKCKKLTGGDIESMDELETILTGSEFSVIVATPQTVFNYFLAFESSTMKRFSLVVFDECHNAKGGDPYNRLLNQYMDEKFQNNRSRLYMPQIIGLTATVGIGDAKDSFSARSYIISLCSRIDLQAHPSEVIRHKEELEAIRNPPVEVHRIIEDQRTDPFSIFIKTDIIATILSDFKRKLRETRSLCRIRFSPPNDIMLQSFEQRCTQVENDLSKIHDARRDDEARDCVITMKQLKVFRQTLIWANLAQLSNAMSYLTEELSKPELQGNKFYAKYQEEWAGKLEELANQEAECPNPKLTLLKHELDEIMSPANCQNGELPRVMIFVEFRRLAYMISNWINGLGPQYLSERFVSRLVSAGDFGMKSEEARTVMQKFRHGQLNILVATSVLSEGVDIPSCNGTIRYMYIKDVIAEVQVPGRMRSWGGRVVAIVNDKLHKLYQENKRKETLMGEALAQIRQIPIDTFIKMMEEEQRRDYEERKALKERQMRTLGGGSKPRDAQINCKQCGSHVGQLADVYRYLEAHYIILAQDLHEKVKAREGVEFVGNSLDGMMDIGILVCREKNCNSELGRVIRIKVSGYSRKIGIWDIEKIRLVDSSDNFAKWEKVSNSYRITDIKQEGLRNKVQSGHFIRDD